MEASSTINTPHPDDSEDDAKAFFGLDDEERDEALAKEAEEATQPVEDDQSESKAEPEAVTPPAKTVEEGEEPVHPGGEPDPDESEPVGESAPPPAEPEAASSVKQDREYVVFQKATLTEKSLKGLLASLAAGNPPRVALFELHRVVARNVNTAITVAYNEHQAGLGEKADLAAVTTRSLQERHVEPRQVVDTALSIT